MPKKSDDITPPSTKEAAQGVHIAEAISCCTSPLITISNGSRMTCANCQAVHQRQPDRDFWLPVDLANESPVTS